MKLKYKCGVIDSITAEQINKINNSGGWYLVGLVIKHNKKEHDIKSLELSDMVCIKPEWEEDK